MDKASKGLFENRRCQGLCVPHRSVAADVSRLILLPWPASKGMHRKRSDPAHAGCYRPAWTSTGASAAAGIGAKWCILELSVGASQGSAHAGRRVRVCVQRSADCQSAGRCRSSQIPARAQSCRMASLRYSRLAVCATKPAEALNTYGSGDPALESAALDRGGARRRFSLTSC